MRIKWTDNTKDLPIGRINKDDIRDIPDDIAKLYIKQGQAIEYKEKKHIKSKEDKD
jgi:hypothetical protein